MKLKMDRAALLEVLSTVAPAARGDFPLKLEAADGELRIVATNLELTISSKLDAIVEETGTAYVTHQALRDRAKVMTADELSLAVEESGLVLRAGKARYRIPMPSGEDYPKITMPESEATTVDGKALAAALRQVVPAASTDNTRMVLTGVLFDPTDDGLRLVATDSYRLAVRDLPGSGFLSTRALVPAVALAALERSIDGGEIAVRADDRRIAFASNRTVIQSRLIGEEFPNYAALLPTNATTKWSTSRAELLETLKRAEVLLKHTSSPVRVTLAATVTVSAALAGDEFVEETDAGTRTGAEITFAVTPTMLRAGVEACGGEEITLELTDPLRPIKLTAADDPRITYIVMPMRV